MAVKAFESATAFLESCSPQTSGCIVLDIRMPDMDGLKVQDELKRRGILLPVIFLTGHGDVPLSVRAMKAGAYDFLEKPVPAETLLARIEGAMRADSQRRRIQTEREYASTRLSQLTPREEGILALLLRGKPTRRSRSNWASAPGPSRFTAKTSLPRPGPPTSSN
ncbi:MAG: response regulator transcription factor, partial [Rubrivivax sp.]|nr:response regulator transcription factor [Rubrivivax sp.]